MAVLKGKGAESQQSEALDATDDELAKYFQEEDCSAVDQVLGDIGHILDCLLRLSAVIRNPAPHDQFRSRVGAEAMPYYEEWDTKHVVEKYANVSTTIAERLGRAMALRRQYFKYREDHANRLAEGLDTEVNMDDPDQSEKATTVASPLPEHLKDLGKEGKSATLDIATLDDTRSEASGTSYAPSTFGSDGLRIPPMPKGYGEGPVRCPFCHMWISIETRYAWKYVILLSLASPPC